MLTERARCVEPSLAMSVLTASELPVSDPNEKLERILDAALDQFAAYGFSRTPMADIAKAAKMSRPALYLHFRNKEEIFRATLETILSGAWARAQPAQPRKPRKPSGRRKASTASASGNRMEARLDGEIAAQLTEFLQRYHGDLMELFTETMHGDDLLAAEHSRSADILADAAKRSRAGMTRYFSELTARGAFDPERSGQPAARWVELILLSPNGLKQDRPTVAQYRRRLDALAISVASGMRGR
jgi:AcrR family transcriptional regulator